MREVIFDTETTGLSPSAGHRLVEIGCVELLNLVPTGQTFHRYVNPQRDMPDEAFRVHGLSEVFLKDYPPFQEIAKDFLAFIGNSALVAHNASFDLKFLNAELQQAQLPPLSNPVVDTLRLSKKKFPGFGASLDALCRRFSIDTTKRDKHGALLDSHLLAAVYLELKGGKQPSLFSSNTTPEDALGDLDVVSKKNAVLPTNKELSIETKNLTFFSYGILPEEKEAHNRLMEKIQQHPWG